MSHWGELKRRNVFKVGAAYLVLAWLIVQVVSALNDPLSLPDWLDTVVVVLLAIGLPVALLSAWAYELQPQGGDGVDASDTASVRQKVAGQKLNAFLIALLVAAVAFLFVDNYLLDENADSIASESTNGTTDPAALPTEAVANSIAVLPFDNLTPNPDDAYYAEGIHAEVISQLTKLSTLTVTVRDSVLRYRPNDRPPLDQIANELRVRYLMSGTTRYQDGDFRVEVSLIDPGTGSALWGDVYQDDFSVSGVLAAQADIAMNVANTINARFSAAEQARIERIPTESTTAYTHYLSARNLISLFRFGDAIRELDLAIQSDPDFAEAYAQRADLYAYGQITSNARFQLLDQIEGNGDDFAAVALENAFNALELYPELGTPWVARALTHKFHFRRDDARRAFEQAYSLSPNEIRVLQEYAVFQQEAGNSSSSVELIERALDLDPNGSLTLIYGAEIFNAAGRATDARNLVQRALAANPDDSMANFYAALFATDQDARRQYLTTGRELMPNPMLVPFSSNLYRSIGDDATADELWDTWEDWATDIGVGAGDWTQYHLAIGNHDRAYDYLLDAVESLENGQADAGYIALTRFLNGPRPSPLDEPRFSQLLDRLAALR